MSVVLGLVLPSAKATNSGIDPTGAIEVLKVLAWPVVVAAALWVYRTPLSQFLTRFGEALAQRGTKFSVAQFFAIELSPAPEFQVPWQPPELGGDDFRKPTTAGGALFSYAPILLEVMQKGDVYDYVVVNLGQGDQWITSRLFIFAIMLQRMARLRYFVFVESNGRFLGLASPEGVRWALAQAYPWLEKAFVDAYAAALPLNPPAGTPPDIRSDSGALDPQMGAGILQAYLTGIRMEPLGGDKDKREWVQLTDPPRDRWEHAHWLTGGLLATLLRDSLQDASILDTLDAATQAKAVLATTEDFVAVVRASGAFKHLSDRHAYLEAALRRAVEMSNSQPSPHQEQQQTAG